MSTINIKGKANPKDSQLVKLELVFFKTDYARVSKVVNITGSFSTGILKPNASNLTGQATEKKQTTTRIKISIPEGCRRVGRARYYLGSSAMVTLLRHNTQKK